MNKLVILIILLSVLVSCSRTQTLDVASEGNQMAESSPSTKGSDIIKSNSPDELIDNLQTAINSNNKNMLKGLFQYNSGSEAFSIFIGKNFKIIPKTPLANKTEKYSHLNEKYSNKIGESPFSNKPTNSALSVLNMTSENSATTIFSKMRKFSDGWKIDYMSFFYIDVNTRVIDSLLNKNQNLFGFVVIYSPELENKISKIDFYQNDKLICSSNKIDYKLQNQGNKLLVNVNCDFKELDVSPQNSEKSILVKLKVYSMDGKTIDGVYYREVQGVT